MQPSTATGEICRRFKSLATQVEVTNEPQRIDCGAPDYILTRKGIPVDSASKTFAITSASSLR